jgi:hypothetical protein
MKPIGGGVSSSASFFAPPPQLARLVPTISGSGPASSSRLLRVGGSGGGERVGAGQEVLSEPLLHRRIHRRRQRQGDRTPARSARLRPRALAAPCLPSASRGSLRVPPSPRHPSPAPRAPTRAIPGSGRRLAEPRRNRAGAAGPGRGLGRVGTRTPRL